jgi:pimeloyl-ACP methyl ester carboxylesterase
VKLVFVHGAGESSLSFHYQLRHFEGAEGVDLPGHPVGRPCASVDGYVEWVRGFIAGRGHKNVILCGHSMGGAITQLYALKYPDELKGIVLVGTGARLKVDPKYLKDCEDGIGGRDGWLANREAEYARIDPDLVKELLLRSAQVGPSVKLNDLLCCDRFDIMDRVPEIVVPALMVCGTEDVMTPVKYSAYLDDRIKNSRITVLEGATHYVMMERHREVNRAIAEFVEELG